jgi:DNA-binding LacI/PurR family transcriptional regulator
MQKRSTEHFDFYYFRSSTVRNDIAEICAQKEKGFEDICKFLGKKSSDRITHIFFEDEKTKISGDRHQGIGWALRNTNVEVAATDKTRPYHEIAHIFNAAFTHSAGNV